MKLLSALMRTTRFTTRAAPLSAAPSVPVSLQTTPLLVNLLPWRAQRRRARLRLWLALLLPGSLICSAITGYCYWQLTWQNQQLIQQTDQQQAMNQALRQRVHAGQIAWQQQQARQRLIAEQQHLKTWPPLLQQLAGALPDSVWFSRLEYQQSVMQASVAQHPPAQQIPEKSAPTTSAPVKPYPLQQLHITGYALSLNELQRFADRLHHLPAIATVQTGDTQFIDDKWQFSLLLTRAAP